MSQVILAAGPIARAKNGVIGRDGELPWRLKSDLAIFRPTGDSGDVTIEARSAGLDTGTSRFSIQGA